MEKKIIIILFLLFLLLSKISTAQFPCQLPDSIYWTNVPGAGMNYTNVEIRIFNQTNYFRTYHNGEEESDTIKVKIFPVGFFFNGDLKYTRKAKVRIQPDSNITGIEINIPPQSSPSSYSFISGNHDKSPGNLSECKFSFGYGKYKFEFYKRVYNDSLLNFEWIFANYVYVDYSDADDHLGFPFGDAIDMRLDYFSQDTITFQHAPHYSNDMNYPSKFWHINSVNRDIKMWNLFGSCIPPLTPSKGIFYSDSTSGSPYLKWPINANKYNGNIGHENPGDLGMNVVINHDVTTRDTLNQYPTIIIIPTNGNLKISTGKTLNMIPAVGGSANLVVQDSSFIELLPNSYLIVGNNNSITLKRKGVIQIDKNAQVLIKNGGYFCTEGGVVYGGRITYDTGYHIYCSSADYFFQDSSKLVLSDYAILEIPDSVTMNFTGLESGLIMNPNSKLKLGVGSKIVFDSSATLKANGATFTSLDSNYLWEGIVFNNSGYDTIKNCTFKNAKTSISIINSGNFSYIRRILRDNIFYVPSGGDYKGIYGENNYRITIAGNTFNMPVVSSGSYIYTGIYLKNSSTSGIQMEDEEPVPQYMMNIVNNVFNNGSTSIILANYISTLSTYYVGKNTFNNASDINLIA